MLSPPLFRDSVSTMSSDLMNIDSDMKEIVERYESLVKNVEKDSDVQIKTCCDLYQELNRMKMTVAFYEEKINRYMKKVKLHRYDLCQHNYRREYPSGPRDNGEFDLVCDKCGHSY